MKDRIFDVQELVDILSPNYSNSEEFFRKLLIFLVKITESEIGGLYFPDPFEKKGLELKYYVEKTDGNFKFLIKENYYLAPDKGIVGWVYRNKSIYISDDTETDKFYIPVEDIKKSDIAFPILSDEGKVILIVNLESKQKDKYTKIDIENLNLLIPLISRFVNYNYKLQSKEYEIKFYKSLYSVYKIFQNIDDLNTLFTKLMNFLVNTAGIERGMIFLINEQKDEIRITNSFGLTEDEIRRGVYKLGEGIVGTVALTSKPISVPNIWEDKRFLNKTRARRHKSKIISFFANPIKFGDEILGVITVEREFSNLEEFKTIEKILNEISDLIAISVLRYLKLKKEREELINENISLREQLSKRYSIYNIIGNSKSMMKVFDIISTVSKTNSTVLIEGESGTGKELVARAIHFASDRRDGPFVVINCAAIPETLLESELFGYKKGSFTGATVDRDGKILMANRGTLFLDEIGDMPIQLQAKLLRVIQEKEVEPIGGKPVKVDVRFISATNKNLEKLVEEGKFRLDLYYRLNVVKVTLPPLRERIEDIPLLVDHFIKKFAREHNKNISRIDKEFIELLTLHNWPGNVRELENVVEQAVVMSTDGVISKSLLPRYIFNKTTSKMNYEEKISEAITEFIQSNDIDSESNLYEKIVSPVIKTLLNQLLVRTNKNKLKASKILGINRNTLFSYIKKYKL
ncbi:MAG: sigma 54-interacting transcriptional regulator [Brevinematales bacterium]|nr:sigma 54-interacting transcriptional regulator [Brevinematales bacterium]